MEEIQQEDVFVINDLETLRVLADPLRTQILELLVKESLTVRQLAERLGLAPSKLYYHFSLLEKHGLIRVVDTRMVANMIEKQYRSVARDFDIDRNLLSFQTNAGQENLDSLLRTTLDATRDDIQRSIQARLRQRERGAKEQPREVVLTRIKSRLSEEQANEFRERLKALILEIEAAHATAAGPEAELLPYGLMLAFYPSFYYSSEEGEENG